MVCRPARVKRNLLQALHLGDQGGTSSSRGLADLIAGPSIQHRRPAARPAALPLPTGFCAAARLSTTRTRSRSSSVGMSSTGLCRFACHAGDEL